MDCLFCKIVKKEIPAEIVYEDDHALAFLDVHPRARGHTMVISKCHSESLLDLPDQEVDPLFHAVKKIAEHIVKALKTDGLTIGINQGRASGQLIDHLHIHILPRFENDRGGSVHSVVNMPGEEDLHEVAKKLRVE